MVLFDVLYILYVYRYTCSEVKFEIAEMIKNETLIQKFAVEIVIKREKSRLDSTKKSRYACLARSHCSISLNLWMFLRIFSRALTSSRERTVARYAKENELSRETNRFYDRVVIKGIMPLLPRYF